MLKRVGRSKSHRYLAWTSTGPQILHGVSPPCVGAAGHDVWAFQRLPHGARAVVSLMCSHFSFEG